jgi:hypothetical protein
MYHFTNRRNCTEVASTRRHADVHISKVFLYIFFFQVPQVKVICDSLRGVVVKYKSLQYYKKSFVTSHFSFWRRRFFLHSLLVVERKSKQLLQHIIP